MGLTFLAPTSTSLAADVQRAQATADNARQMILNRDPRLATVESNYAAIVALTNRIAARQITTGDVKTTSLLALGTTTDVTVTLGKDMGADTYGVVIIRTSAGVQLGNADLTVKAQTPTTVTVSVKAGVAIAAGATFTVLAWT